MWEQNCWICSKMVNINEKVIGNHLKVGNQYFILANTTKNLGFMPIIFGKDINKM